MNRLALCLFLIASYQLTSAAPPNIIFILADDLGYGDVGCYNSESTIPTPHLDQMAADGMRFTDAHSPSTVCTPSRYSLMTGQMAFRLNYAGVFTGVGGPCLITEDQLTLPGMLRDQGYETAMFGKWHIGLSFLDENGEFIDVRARAKGRDKTTNTNPGLAAVQSVDYTRPILDGPLNRGFDHFFGTACCPTTDWLYAYIDGDRIPVPPTKLVDKAKLPEHEWSFDCRPGMVAPDFDLEEVDMVFLDKSLNFLDEHHAKQPAKPFFLFHSLQAVHLPSFPGKAFKGKTNSGPHGDFIFECDYVVGALLEKLEELGIADNTLVVFSSDNGPEMETAIYMRQLHQHDGARPWRGLKRDNWEGGHRVPMIARWPGVIDPGTITDQTVSLTDIMATCAAIVGAELPHDAAEDSFNILPVLKGEAEEPIRDFTLQQTIRLSLSIREGDWKYLDHQDSGGNNYARPILAGLDLPNTAPDAPGQLYNLADDPGETTNLYLKFPEIVTRLQNQLREFQESGRSAPAR